MPPRRSSTRETLQLLGHKLDVIEGGEWVARAVATLAEERAPTVVDSVRTAEQIEAVRSVAPSLHVHLTASREVLEQRYGVRSREHPEFEFVTYASILGDANERTIDQLSSTANVVVDTGRRDQAATLEHVISAFPSGHDRAGA